MEAQQPDQTCHLCLAPRAAQLLIIRRRLFTPVQLVVTGCFCKQPLGSGHVRGFHQVRATSPTLGLTRMLWASPVGGEAAGRSGATHTSLTAFTMRPRPRALSRSPVALVLMLQLVHAPGLVAEFSSKSELDYEFGDYRGKWCIDDHGFVYGIGELYYPSPTACPCTCTVDGPVCVRPKCPRIHPRCTRIRYKACCPVCEAVARVCVYGGKTYRLLEEFRVSSPPTATGVYSS